jgi:glucarate dehydratase
MIDTRITGLEVVPIAFSDPPLLNAAGVHEPLAPSDDVVPAVRDAVLGLDVFATSRIEAAVDAVLRRGPSSARGPT